MSQQSTYLQNIIPLSKCNTIMTILRRLEFLLELMGPTAWKTMLPATLSVPLTSQLSVTGGSHCEIKCHYLTETANYTEIVRYSAISLRPAVIAPMCFIASPISWSHELASDNNRQ